MRQWPKSSGGSGTFLRLHQEGIQRQIGKGPVLSQVSQPGGRQLHSRGDGRDHLVHGDRRLGQRDTDTGEEGKHISVTMKKIASGTAGLDNK